MLNAANSQILVTTVNTMLTNFYAMDLQASFADNLTSTISTDSSQVTFYWTGRMPKFRQWYGARQTKQPGALQSYTVIPKPWESTVSIDQFTLDDDVYGVWAPQLQQMAYQARRHKDYQVRDLLEGTGAYTGAAQNGLDGLTFFNTAHPVDINSTQYGTYSNDFTGGGQVVNGTTVGGALSVAGLTSLYEYMSTIRGEDGERLGIKPDTLTVPTTLEGEAQALINSTFLASPTWGAFQPLTGQVGTADNPLQRFGLKLVVNPWLEQTRRWYLMSSVGGFKPMVWVEREPLHIVSKTADSDDNVFNAHMYTWGGWMRNTIGWGFSFLIARSGP